ATPSLLARLPFAGRVRVDEQSCLVMYPRPRGERSAKHDVEGSFCEQVLAYIDSSLFILVLRLFRRRSLYTTGQCDLQLRISLFKDITTVAPAAALHIERTSYGQKPPRYRRANQSARRDRAQADFKKKHRRF